MILTGNIGNNLKNSILMVLSYLINKKYINEDDYFHINFNVNKYTLDGYSGGLGVASSIISLNPTRCFVLVPEIPSSA